MDDESRTAKGLNWALGAVGLGAIAAIVVVPTAKYKLWVALAILLLFLLLFGGYLLWRRMRARRQREKFSSALEAQTSAAPKTISDPNQRASLDRVRQKFQTGLQEFRSRGKDIYKLPWYVIIGESGSGKTEAIRHSGIDFPPGLQDELQGSGGTVNMDWWFTNRGIILDTAGSMLFNEARAGEAPEWREFLRLLKRARPHCPINGLFLVLSVESLIRDSADIIAQKAGRFAQQLDLLQRTLDVRFPVYLLVTKCDLLTGFREFFDNIEDPLLQHQMFGWSNPDPLDGHFRPDLVEDHLRSVAARLRRRRLALLREIAGSNRLGDTQHFFSSSYQLGRGPMTSRRLDEVDSLFALPESVMRLAPRLRRYLETIFVAGEWSAKPVFLRGIYFTSSMREGKALDEAIAFATGLALDQLPEEERTWDKNRAFFLRDLFLEKVFRESGLVTRATNTLKLLRQRQLAIFGTAAVALLLLLVFAGLAYRNLKNSVLAEADYWRTGAAMATNLNQGALSAAIVTPGSTEPQRFNYNGTNLVQTGSRQITLVDYHQELVKTVQRKLAVGFIFKPMVWLGLGNVSERREAQRLLFEASVLKPLVRKTREKMEKVSPPPQDAAAVARHLEGLLALIHLEADTLASGAKGGVIGTTNAGSNSEKYLKGFLSYLTETTNAPDTNVISAMAWTYSRQGSGAGKWPPPYASGGSRLADNPAIRTGLENFRKANQLAELSIASEVQTLNALVQGLTNYQLAEITWLQSSGDCTALRTTLMPPKEPVDQNWTALLATNYTRLPLTNLAARYRLLETAATATSAAAFTNITADVPDEYKTKGIIYEIFDELKRFASEAGAVVRSHYVARSNAVAGLDRDYIVPINGLPAYQSRWSLYTGACDLASAKVLPVEQDVGSKWTNYATLSASAARYQSKLAAYKGPLGEQVSTACDRISTNALQQLKQGYLTAFSKLVLDKFRELNRKEWTPEAVTLAADWLGRVQIDLDAGGPNGIADERLGDIRRSMEQSRQAILSGLSEYLSKTVGFPVVLNGPQVQNLPVLLSLKKLLKSIKDEMQKPAWKSDGCNALLAKCARYETVLSALVKEDGSAAQWKLGFVFSDDQNDKNLAHKFRFVQVALGNQRLEPRDIAGDKDLPLGTGNVDAKLGISFGLFTTDKMDVEGPKFESWGLIGLIRDSSKTAERLDEGKRWRFRVKPKGSEAAEGSLLFEAILDQPLPKLEDWRMPAP